MFTLSFGGLPEEVTDYAFDQFEDRLLGPERESAEEAVYGDEPVELDYDTQFVMLHDTVLTRVLHDAMAEKIRDIEREVERNERDDFTLDDVSLMRRRLDAIFSGRAIETVPADSLEYVLDLVGSDVYDWYEPDEAAEAAGHLVRIYEAMGNTRAADTYREYIND